MKPSERINELFKKNKEEGFVTSEAVQEAIMQYLDSQYEAEQKKYYYLSLSSFPSSVESFG